MTDRTQWPAPLALLESRVEADWVDYNGHMSEAFYVLVLGYATDALLDAIGMDEAFRTASGMSMYTLEAHIRYLTEVGEGAPLRATTHVLGCDAKRVHLLHRLHEGEHERLLATEELLLCNVDRAAGRSAPMPEEIAARVRAIADAHQRLPYPEEAGRSITLRR